MRLSKSLIVPTLGLGLTLAACVESRDLPDISPQTTVTYGEKLYLVDTTVGARPSGDVCTQLGTDTATDGASLELEGIDPDTPFNCYVRLEPTEPSLQRQLRVDVTEVTNELFQLCVDSGACQGPDPSKSSAAQVCQVQDDFDVCPVVEVPQLEAANFCKWIGRRLPTGFEHLVMRQGNLQNTQDPTAITDYVGGDGTSAPSTCDDAVLGTAGCMATKPRPVLDASGAPAGGAPRDVVDGETGPVFDLVGNLAEWTSDLFPTRQGNQNDLPWFCVAGLTRTSTSPFTVDNPPACPEGATCVWGKYRLSEDDPVNEYPVCITTDEGRFSGVVGAVHGASHRTETPSPEEVGIYARSLETDPQGLAETSRARGYGFRCVGNRESGMRDDNGDLELPPFDDVFRVVNPND